MAKLWYRGRSIPNPLWIFGRKIVFLAMSSLLENCQICLKIYASSCCWISFGIGNIFLRKVVLDRTSVYNMIAFPSKKWCLLNSCFTGFHMAKLRCWGRSIPNPLWRFERKSVFPAMGFLLENCQIYMKI